MNKLKNCFICNNGDIVMKRKKLNNEPLEFRYLFRYLCKQCFIRTAWWPTEEDAKRAWNTRKSLDK